MFGGNASEVIETDLETATAVLISCWVASPP
jgi:hypothetical protein